MERRPCCKIAAGVAMMIAFAVGGCLGPDGIKKEVWTKPELVEWYGKHLANDARSKHLGYRGSDVDHHHFVCRPIDSFLFLKVSRAELQIADERPVVNSSSGPIAHYQVDPLNDFRKVASP